MFNEIARVPFNPYNSLSLIATLFPEESLSQTQTESPSKTASDAQKRIEVTTLVNHISKGLTRLSEEEQEYIPPCVPFVGVGIDGSSYDASSHPTLVKNQDKMPWKKLVTVLNSYLDSTKILFERSEVFVNPERRIQGVRIDDKMIRKVPQPVYFALKLGGGSITT